MFLRMRVARERLLFHALVTLEDEAKRATQEGALPRGPHVRLALGVLYALSPNPEGDDMLAAQRIYCEYLCECSDTDTRTSQGFGRWQMLNSCLNAMARAAGIDRGPDYDEARLRLYG